MTPTRNFHNNPNDDLQAQINLLKEKLRDLANRQQVIIPVWTAATIPTTFPDGVEGEFVIGENEIAYIWKDGAWVSISVISGGMIFSLSGVLVVANGILRWYPRHAGTVSEVHCAVGVAPTGSGVTVRLNKNGSSVGTGTIAASAFTTTFIPSPASFTVGDYFTIDVTAVGSTIAGSGLVVQIGVS